jgi:hypothetical protein
VKAVLFAAVMLFALSACSTVDLPEAEVYALATINDATLPGPHPDSDFIEVTSGSLTLHADGRVTAETVVRCKSSLPQGTTCEIEGDGRMTSVGTYSAAEGWVQFGEPSWQGDGQAPAEFETDVVRITYFRPPSQGFSPTYQFEYRR